MFPPAKNTTPFWYPQSVNFQEKSSYPFGSYPKPQIFDLVVLAAYPFGSILSSVSKGVYRYGMNTQEKDNEIYGEGNSYSAEYWQYDARLARRWNVDPVVKVHESPYATFANNPIWFVDPSGADTAFTRDEYGLQAQKEFDETINELDGKIQSVKNSIIENEKRIANKKWYNSEKKLLQKKSNLNTRLSDLKEVRGVFDEILTSKVTFRYSVSTIGFKKDQVGATKPHDPNGKIVDIRFVSGNKGALVHENRHGVGVLRGELGLGNDGYDYMDEYEAFRHQEIYDPIGTRNSIEKAKQEQGGQSLNNLNYGIMEMIRYLYDDWPGIDKSEKQIKANENSPYLKYLNSN
jgi:hypothetical protein